MNKSLRNILLPYQRAWVADRSAVKVYEKSRRIGITWAEAADRALAAAASKPGGMDSWYIGYNKDMAREFIDTTADWARRFNKAADAIEEIAIDDEDHDILSYRIFRLRSQGCGAFVAAIKLAWQGWVCSDR